MHLALAARILDQKRTDEIIGGLADGDEASPFRMSCFGQHVLPRRQFQHVAPIALFTRHASFAPQFARNAIQSQTDALLPDVVIHHQQETTRPACNLLRIESVWAERDEFCLKIGPRAPLKSSR